MEPWKRNEGLKHTETEKCFNGATAMEPWKRACGKAGIPAWSPLQWGHGDGAVEESPILSKQATMPIRLQWGHGDGAVEEVEQMKRALSVSEASMGPRRWSRGRDGDGPG